MKWYVVRHADKEQGDFHNPLLRHQDEPISARGRSKAQKLYTFFLNRPVTKIYVSEYMRTGQTIEYTAQKMGLTPITDRRLNEIDNGAIEGLSEQELRLKFPELWNAFMERNRDFQFPQGESGSDVQQRIRSFMEEMQTRQEDILIVSHDGWMRTLMCSLLDIPVYRRWDFQIDFCGIIEIEYQPAYTKWKLIRFNHLCT